MGIQLPILLSVLLQVIKSSTGPRVKLVSCKSALTSSFAPPPPPLPPPPSHAHPPCGFILLTRFKTVVPVLVLLFVAFWFILWGDLF